MSDETEVNYAYGAYGSAGVVGAVSLVGGFYGVVTRSRTRPNMAFLLPGLTLASVPAALGVGLTAYAGYKQSGKKVEKLHQLFEKEKAEYTKFMQQAAIGQMIASAGVPLTTSILLYFLNENRLFLYSGAAGAVLVIGGMSAYGANYASAQNELKKTISA